MYIDIYIDTHIQNSNIWLQRTKVVASSVVYLTLILVNPMYSVDLVSCQKASPQGFVALPNAASFQYHALSQNPKSFQNFA